MSLVENRLGQNRAISPRSKQVQKGAGQRIRGQGRQAGIYSNNAGELGTKTQDNLAEDKWK